MDSLKFCGLTVQNIRTSVGWNDQVSSMGISLVQDVGDINLLPPVGSPVWTTYGSMSFNGILQRVEESIGVGGRIMNATVVDPREIVRACNLIIGDYNGSVFMIPNLVNCFGYYENGLGFGGANATSAGMPWYLIRQAINTLVNSPYDGPFGGPLAYKGYRYSIDISQLPSMPAFYRIAGANISLMDAISQVCADGNCDFFVTLSGYRIVINCVNKGRIIPQGILRSFVVNNTLHSQNAVDGSFGIEDAVSEITNVMVVGGNKEDLHETTAIKSFWGYDYRNRAIFGDPSYYFWVPYKGINAESAYDFEAGKVDFNKNKPIPRCFIRKLDPHIYNPNDPLDVVSLTTDENINYDYKAIEATEVAALNSTIINDIVGSNIYYCSTIEMRMAATSRDAWEDFIEKVRPEMYIKIYGVAPADNRRAGNAVVNPDLVKDDPKQVKQVNNAIQEDVNENKAIKFYTFVREYAENFYGKIYACRLPLIAGAINLETLQIVNAADVTGSAYKVEGSQPLGLSVLNSNVFTDDNNKFFGFCTQNNIGTVLEGISTTSSIVQGNLLYQRVTVEPELLRDGVSIYAVFSLSAPLHENPEGMLGNMEINAAIKRLTKKILLSGVSTFADFDGISPDRRPPLSVAIPMKSNVESYGPWWAKVGEGKTQFIKDDSIVPWNFGGYDAMTLYGQAQVASIKGAGQFAESGQITLAGAPVVDLGRAVYSIGPSCTDISCNIGEQGVTTTYTFRVFTPRTGQLPKQFVERLRSVSVATQKVRRDLRDSVKESLTLKQIKSDNRKTANFETMMKKEMKRNTPSDVIVCNFYEDNLNDNNYNSERKIYTQISNLKEALTMLNVNDNNRYRFNTVMSLNGIFVPFSLDANSTDAGMPKIVKVAAWSNNSIPFITSDTYNHFNNSSINVIGYGTKYEGVKYKKGQDIKKYKPVAFRGPLWLNGYGTSFKKLDGHKSDTRTCKTKDWMVGPVDLLFDNYRGVWTPHTNMVCKSTSNISAANANFTTTAAASDMGVGTVVILADLAGKFGNIMRDSSGNNATIQCKNPFQKQISPNIIVTVAWCPQYHNFVITGADCV